MSEPRHRVTLNDVAAASGVSRATASFVLRDSPGQSISAATSERVRAAARSLGYVPNGIARALREGTSRIVILVMDPAMEGNYARSYTRGLDAELAAHDHVLLIRYAHGPASAGSAARGDFPLGGAQSPGELGGDPVLDAIVPRAVLLFGGAYLTGHELDDSGGGRRDGLAAHVSAQIGYLFERGHRRLALALPADSPLCEIRQRFANQAAAALGMPPLAPLFISRSGDCESSSVTDAAASLSALLATEAERPDSANCPGRITAIAAFDDDVALRVLSAMRVLALTAPADLAVIGFDDNGYGALTKPTLTTVHIDAEVHGRQTARAILGKPADDLSPAPGKVITRESA